MLLIELLNTAARGWDRATEGLGTPLESHWVEEGGLIKSNPLCDIVLISGPVCEDRVGHVAVDEILNTYESRKPDEDQMREAARVVERLGLDLLGIAFELRALDMVPIMNDADTPQKPPLGA